MSAQRSSPLAVLVLFIAASHAGAQEDAGRSLRLRSVGTATLDMRTGEIVRGGSPAEKAIAEENCYANTDTSGFYSVGAANQGDEWLDWALFQNCAEGIVTSFSFAYGTTSLDTSAGGPGADLSVSFYQGATGFCADGGAQPVASFSFTGLPAATTGVPSGFGVGWILTVDLTGGFEFCTTAGPFGFSMKGGGDDGAGAAQTGPILCQAGDGFGGPDANGGFDAIDIWTPDLAGACSGTFVFGQFGSFYLELNQVDEDASTQAASVFNAGSPPNLPNYLVLGAPRLGGSLSGVVADVKLHPFYFIVVYPGGTLNLPLGPCRTVIVDITQPQLLAAGPFPNGSLFDVAVGKNTDFCGQAISTQAICVGGGIPWSLTNAWDCTVGF